ncbi:MAG TPA: ABC transporter substrate-binding protein [Flavobacterium sp.]|nr:ABC transporter substrate-binding protein [Flavobacterium sp.]HPJ11295.1 ABC transporter substrate-binding protein [Flavobacterium sp.]
MKITLPPFYLLLLVILVSGCKRDDNANTLSKPAATNQIRQAKGLEIYGYQGYSIVKISNPWPKATKEYTYVLQQKNAVIPDSLKTFPVIPVPIRTIVVTSTTHIPSLEMLGEENTLVGFPSLDLISSEKIRTRIESGKIKELGNNQNLNTEVLIDLQPDLIVGFGIDNNNPTLDNLQKNGLQIMLNGDWNEQSPLGKAEWIKFFGALYNKEDLAEKLFANIEKEYQTTLALAQKAASKPTVVQGAIYENQWYLPHGNSWGSVFIRDAGGKYIWSESQGTGSLSLPFETVLEKAGEADFWIGPAQFTSLKAMTTDNPHYSQFKAYRNKKVYSFSNKKGKTGGLIFYELAPNRPDLVLKDMLKILHPELLPDYQLYFFEQLR